MSSKLFICRVLLLLCVVCYGSSANADILLDNTGQGTAAINGNSGSNLTQTATKQGLQFDIDAGWTFNLTDLKVAIQSTSTSAPTFDVQLWSWNGTGASVLGSQTFTSSSATRAYYDFSFTDSVFSNLTSGSYLLTLSSANMQWAIGDPQTLPTSPTTGFSFVQYRRSTNGGSTWVDTLNRNTIFLQGVGSQGGASVPEPTSLAMLGLCAGAAAFRSRRSLSMRIKGVMRRS